MLYVIVRFSEGGIGVYQTLDLSVAIKAVALARKLGHHAVISRKVA